MEKEKDSVSNFLNEFSDGDKPKDIFKEEKIEEPIVEEEDEKPLPYYKDPKIQRFIAKEVDKRLKDVRPSAEQTFKQEVNDINLPSSFVKLVGNDTPEKVEVLKDLSKYFGTLKGEARQEFLNEMKEQQEQSVREDVQAQEELDTYFEEIEETYGVDISSNSTSAKKTRSEFIDYVRDIAPKNEDGEVKEFPDLVAAFRRFQATEQRPPASRAKELASRGMTRSTDTSTATPQGRSWKDVDRFFDKLKASN